MQCIQMIPDEEGFLYPVVDTETCIHCGRCEQVCPVSAKREEKSFPQEAYVLQHRDEDVRHESTSGGAFSAIAEWIIGQGGVVFGAAFTDDFTVIHTAVEEKKDLWKFRNSKYVQSDVGRTYEEAAACLSQGRWVCYSGTPCQIEGLAAYLGKPYERLITVDIVCHGVPSPLIWRKYLEMQDGKLGSYAGIRFRDKYYGYKYSTLSFFDRVGKTIYAHGIDTDQMTRAFFSDICDRPSCYHCPFKKRYRVSDFTLWDCFDVFLYDRRMDDDRGTSSVLIHTDKGRQVFSEVKKQARCRQVSPDLLTSCAKEMFHSVSPNPRRGAFFEDARHLSGQELFDRYFPETARVRCARFLRVSMYRLGIYAPVKRVVTRVKRIRRRQRQA